MKYKRQLIILISAVILYIVFGAVYNKFVVKTNEQKVYMVNDDIKKGNEVSINNLKELTIKTKEQNDDYVVDISNLNNLLTNYDLQKGQIVTKDMFIEKDKYVKTENDKEIVSIKIKTSEDSASYNITKDSLVNIYYTGKIEFANDILKTFNEENIVSGGSTGYISMKLIKEAKILGIYDKYGNEINTNNLNNNNELTIDTVLISTNSKMAMTICNLKEYGDFSLSLVR